AAGEVQVKDLESGEQRALAMGDIGLVGGFLAELRLAGLTGADYSAESFPAWAARVSGAGRDGGTS
ncbi:MAG: hypothetical protein AAGD40_04815, partial [Pseudomonadota bacterium]